MWTKRHPRLFAVYALTVVFVIAPLCVAMCWWGIMMAFRSGSPGVALFLLIATLPFCLWPTIKVVGVLLRRGR